MTTMRVLCSPFGPAPDLLRGESLPGSSSLCLIAQPIFLVEPDDDQKAIMYFMGSLWLYDGKKRNILVQCNAGQDKELVLGRVHTGQMPVIYFPHLQDYCPSAIWQLHTAWPALFFAYPRTRLLTPKVTHTYIGQDNISYQLIRDLFPNNSSPWNDMDMRWPCYPSEHIHGMRPSIVVSFTTKPWTLRQGRRSYWTADME